MFPSPAADDQVRRLAPAHRDRRHRSRQRRGDRGLRRRRDRLGGRRGLLQHGDDRLRGDPDRPFLRRADRHLHLPAHRGGRRQRRGHRSRQSRRRVGRGRRHHARRHFRAVEFSRQGAAGRLAEGARGHRRDRGRHARADDAHSRARHAERGHRPFARRRLRPRRAARRGRALARHRRHGPRSGGRRYPALRLGRDQLDVGEGLRQAASDALSRGRGRLWDQAQHPQDSSTTAAAR